MAMAIQLKKLGKNIACSIKKGVPPSLAFLPESRLIMDDIETDSFDLLITFGCSSLKRTGSTNIQNLKTTNPKLKTLNIDHHPDNENFGDVNVVDSEKSSVAELVYELFKFYKWPVDKNIATCLLTGIITDTGRFMHSNTQGSTLKTAAELMEKGALTNQIIKHAYKNKQTSGFKAWAKALKNARFDKKNKMVISVISEEDQKELGNLPGGVFDGVVETLNTIPEAKFSLFIRQDGEVIKGSLRSDTYKNTDVQKIAKLFGGGGHKLASAFTIPGKLVKDKTGEWKIV